MIKAILSSSAADQLAKLLGLTGSDFAGERAAAAMKANALVHALGLTWPQVITAPRQHPIEEQTGDWRDMRAYCARHPHLLRARERDFVDDLVNWDGDLTDKQRDWLTAIYSRLKRAT